MHAASNDNFRYLVSRLKIRHLALLLQIQKLGSLTRVAEHMATSQPAMTQALSELEDMLGTRLFERTSRGMVATEQGEAVLMYAHTILNDLDRMTLDMEAISKGRVAHLHIGAIPMVSGMKVADAIQRTTSFEKGLSVTVQGGATDQLLQMLRDHSLDLVLARVSDTLDMRDLSYELLHRQSPRVIVHRLTAERLGRRKLNWSELLTMDWVLGHRNTPVRKQIMDVFLNEGLPPPSPTVESHSSHLIGDIIATNEKAVSIVTDDIAEELVRTAGLAIVPYSFDWNLSPLAIFTRTTERQRPINITFCSALRDVFNTTPLSGTKIDTGFGD